MPRLRQGAGVNRLRSAWATRTNQLSRDHGYLGDAGASMGYLRQIAPHAPGASGSPGGVGRHRRCCEPSWCWSLLLPRQLANSNVSGTGVRPWARRVPNRTRRQVPCYPQPKVIPTDAMLSISASSSPTQWNQPQYVMRPFSWPWLYTSASARGSITQIGQRRRDRDRKSAARVATELRRAAQSQVLWRRTGR